ncbi:oligosaccharide flippase family protein [Tamlana sp. s12]|uniref:oligosaccharide flippase family protein n=1 Tax=Tamlana sp. s12 TaxID=1630406 RepID=UPI0007FC17F2|nr:oligosaccharide flippase family protein [Tamlana sp. s12]OBQ55557.1 hypothetical protein VQ01_08925 [Tamlana sp. s12]QQY83770.1 oligosaccharide flippase family protein [Tamlana sp. s12]
MEKQSTSYKQILKSTSLFGGVQIFNILLSVIKTKIITVLVGASGLGVLGLLTSTVKLIVDFTKLGLETSAVKEISEYDSKANRSEFHSFVDVLNKVVWFTAIIGALLCMFFSGWLSTWAFGNSNYKIEFMWLSLAVFFTQLTNGKKAILQGTRQLKKLAKANLWGSFLGLLVAIPIYYYYKIDGIVPSIILSVIIAYFIVVLYVEHKGFKIRKIGIVETFKKSKSMLSLGLSLSVNSLIVALTLWLIQIYIRNSGGLQEVGYYSAGMLIINSYVGLIFNAMGTDYFPRLSAINKDNSLIQKVVNEQAEIAVLLITPIIAVFFVFAPLVLQLLYSQEFIVILGFVTFGVLGTLFKAISFTLGYVIIAKGSSKLFIKISIVFNFLMLLISFFSYKAGGLTGLGVGLVIYYIIHFVTLKILTGYYYQLNLKKSFYRIFFICISICVFSYLGTLVQNRFLHYLWLTLMAIVSLIFTFTEIQKRINIKYLIKGFFKKIEK